MKKKCIIITSIIVIILIVLSVLAFLYYKTNYLKTTEQLFWSYFGQNAEVANIFNNEKIEEIKNKKDNNAYTTISNLTVDSENAMYILNAQTNAKSKNDIVTTVNLNKDSNQIINFNLVKKSNIVGFKMNELANGYICFENSNLKDLAKKMEIENTDNIPDNINICDISDLLELSQEDKEYITKEYADIILKDTNSKNYSKLGPVNVKIDDKFHSADVYKISLTENECKKILKDLCCKLSKDTRVLNLISSKLQRLNLPTEYTDTNNISNKFLEISNNIDKIETTDNKLIDIKSYVENSKLIQTNFIIGEDRTIKIIYDKENNKVDIQQEIKNQNNNKFMLTLSDKINEISKQIKEINIVNDIADDTNTMTTKIQIACESNFNIVYESETKINNEIKQNNDYEKSKKILLNNLTQTQLKNLYNAISASAKLIYENKKTLILGNK